jgi:hypothetical protein
LIERQRRKEDHRPNDAHEHRRSQTIAHRPADLIQYLYETFPADKMREAFWLPDEAGKIQPVKAVLYGEGYGAGIQKGGGQYRKVQAFCLFNVLVADKWWLDWSNVGDVAAKPGHGLGELFFKQHARRYPECSAAEAHADLEKNAPESVRSGVQSPEAKYKLWHIMLAIAAIAGLFAKYGVILTFGVLLAASACLLPICLARPGRRLRAAAWVCSLYPLFIIGSLYATWLAAWCVLGHQPRVSLDDPKYISPIVDVPFALTWAFVFGTPLVLFVSVPIVFAHDLR